MSKDKILKCRWCNKPSHSNYCNDSCRNAYDRYITEEDKYGSIMVTGCLLPNIIILIGVIIGNIMQCVGYTTLIIGAILIILPFGTTETIDLIGAKNTKLIVRLVGIIFIIVGISLVYSYA